MAESESRDDKNVDALIADLRGTLDKLESAQRKDVQDEDSEDYEPRERPKNLREAEQVAYIRVRAHNRRARQARSDDRE